MIELPIRPLVPGYASGELLVLERPLSLWGGLDLHSGRIVGRHPQEGTVVTGRILAMREARGSSSSASVLAEAVRLETAPAAIVLERPDDVIVAGSIVADELYGRTCPVVAVASIAGLRTGARAIVEGDSLLIRGPGSA